MHLKMESSTRAWSVRQALIQTLGLFQGRLHKALLQTSQPFALTKMVRHAVNTSAPSTATAEYEGSRQRRRTQTDRSSRTTQVRSLEFPFVIRWDGTVRSINPTLSSLV